MFLSNILSAGSGARWLGPARNSGIPGLTRSAEEIRAAAADLWLVLRSFGIRAGFGFSGLSDQAGFIAMILSIRPTRSVKKASSPWPSSGVK